MLVDKVGLRAGGVWAHIGPFAHLVLTVAAQSVEIGWGVHLFTDTRLSQLRKEVQVHPPYFFDGRGNHWKGGVIILENQVDWQYKHLAHWANLFGVRLLVVGLGTVGGISATSVETEFHSKGDIRVVKSPFKRAEGGRILLDEAPASRLDRYRLLSSAD